MFSVSQVVPVILAVVQLQQLSFRFMLDMSGSNGDRDAVAVVFALQLQHQSQIGNLYINHHITRFASIMHSCECMTAWSCPGRFEVGT